MQSFKVLLHHRAACRPGGVLVGLFWTDPAGDRSIVSHWRLATDRGNGSARGLDDPPVTPDRASDSPRRPVRRRLSCCAGHASSSLTAPCSVYAPTLHERIGPRLGPIRLFADQMALWESARSRWVAAIEPRMGGSCRVFPQGGLTYVPG